MRTLSESHVEHVTWGLGLARPAIYNFPRSRTMASLFRSLSDVSEFSEDDPEFGCVGRGSEWLWEFTEAIGFRFFLVFLVAGGLLIDAAFLVLRVALSLLVSRTRSGILGAHTGCLGVVGGKEAATMLQQCRWREVGRRFLRRSSFVESQSWREQEILGKILGIEFGVQRGCRRIIGSYEKWAVPDQSR